MKLLDKINLKLKDSKERKLKINEAVKLYQSRNKKFKFYKSLNRIYGKLDLHDSYFYCLSSDRLKEGSILMNDNGTLRFNVVKINREVLEFKHNISGIEPLKMDRCKVQILH